MVTADMIASTFASARLRQAMDALREAIAKRISRQASGSELEPFDRAVCLKARGLAFNCVDDAGWASSPTRDLARMCCLELENALKCLDPKAYPDAEKFHESVQQKFELLQEIAEGAASIEDVLSKAAVAASTGKR